MSVVLTLDQAVTQDQLDTRVFRTSHLFCHPPSNKDLLALIEEIAAEPADRHMYLIVHNIEGPGGLTPPGPSDGDVRWASGASERLALRTRGLLSA